MKDIATPVPPEEVKGVIRKCLEQAAQLNYERIKEYAAIEGNQKHRTRHRNVSAGVNGLLLRCCYKSRNVSVWYASHFTFSDDEMISQCV